MSYGSSVSAAYPSTLSSNDRTKRSSFDNVYQSDVPSRNSGELINEVSAFNQNNYDTTTHRPSLHSLSTDSQNPSLMNSRKSIPQNRSGGTLDDINEYAENLTTASSVARPINNNHINGPMNNFSNSQQYHNLLSNDGDGNSQPQSTKKKQSDERKTKSTFQNQKQSTTTRGQPSKTVHKRSLPDEVNENVAPVQFSQSPSSNVETWLDNSKKKSHVNEKAPKQAWSVKTDQTQHEKQNDKTTGALYNGSKNNDNKPIRNKTKPLPHAIARTATYEIQTDPYFDSLGDEDERIRNPNLHHSTSTAKRVPPTTKVNSWGKQEQIQYPTDSVHLDHSQSEPIHLDLIHKDADERFREALQKLRTERAQQQKELSETTAKRLQYGDYVRNSIKDGLLQEAVKPSAWSDFMELKKGNLYSLSKEEKRQQHDQLRSYAERIRNRNFEMLHEGETARSLQPSGLRTNGMKESGNSTPRQIFNNGNSKSVDHTSKQLDSGLKIKTTSKNQSKQKHVNQMKTNQHSRKSTERSNTYHLSDGDYENNQSKKKQVRYAQYDSAGRETSGVEGHGNDLHSQCPVCLKPRKMNNSLYTLHEEKSLEDTRHKKR